MEDFEQFEQVFGSKADIDYRQQTIDEICHHRQLLENELFIDRLLKTLGIDKASKLYPPGSGLELRKLHEKVVSSHFQSHHKISVLYYLRKEFPYPSRQAAEDLAKKLYLPEKYRILIDGLWFLDRLKFEKALEYLTEPTLIPTYPEEILYTLCRHAPENDSSFPLAYYYTVSPSFQSGKVLEAFFLVLCRSSVMEGFSFSRIQDTETRRMLFEKLINFVLADSSDLNRASRADDFISLPLHDIEETWLNEYLKEGKGRTLLGASDTIIMRELLKGSTNSLLDHDKTTASRKIDGVSWMTFKESTQQSLRHSET